MAELQKVSRTLADVQNYANSTVGAFSKLTQGSVKLGKEFLNVAASGKGLIDTITNLGSTISSAFVGMKAVDAVAKLNRSFYEMSRTSLATGHSIDDLSREIDHLNKTTLLSKKESTDFFKTVQSGALSVSITTKETSKLAQVLMNEYGPSLDRINEATGLLNELQKKNIDVAQNVLRGMDEKTVIGYLQSEVSLGRMNWEQAKEMQKLLTSKNATLTEAQERSRDLERAQKALNQSFEDFIIKFGKPLAKVFEEGAPKVAQFFEKITQYLDDPKISGLIEMLGKGGSIAANVQIGADIVGGLGSVISGLTSIFSSKGTLTNPMIVADIGGLKGGGPAGAATSLSTGILGGLGSVVTALGTAAATFAAVSYGMTYLQDKFGGDTLGNRGLSTTDKFQYFGDWALRGGDDAEKQQRMREGNRSRAADKEASRLALEKARQQGFTVFSEEEANNAQTFAGGQISGIKGSSSNGSNAQTDTQKETLALAEKQDYMLAQKVTLSRQYAEATNIELEQIKTFGGSQERINTILDKRRTNLEETNAILEEIIPREQTSLDLLRSQLTVTTDIAQKKLLQNQIDSLSTSIAQKQNEIRKNVTEINTQYKHGLDLNNAQNEALSAELNAVSSLRELNEAAFGGMGQSIELRQKELDLIEKQKALSAENIAKANAEIARRQALKPDADVLDMKKLISNEMANQNKLQKQQLDLTKSLRDGYLEALTSFNNAEGSFSKIILTREQGVGQAMRQFGAQSNMTLGAIGGGSAAPMKKWNPDGSLQMTSPEEQKRVFNNYYKNRPELIGAKYGPGMASTNQMFEEQQRILQQSQSPGGGISSSAGTSNQPLSTPGLGAGANINLNISGNTIEQIITEVNRLLGKVLKDMMTPLGSSGRQFNLSSQ